MTNGNQKVDLYVTHVNSSGPYLKIWGQINNEKSRTVESALNRLQDRFKHGEGAIPPQTVLIPGTICCAFHEDNYYRAKIIEVNSDYTVYVHFIDYGNTEQVFPTAIRLLSCFSDGLELMALPSIAHEFTLTNVMPYNLIWNENAVEHIKQSLTYKDHPAVVTFPSKQLISLYYNGRDFAEYLLSAKMALPATPEERILISRICEQSAQPIVPTMMPHSIRQIQPIDMSYDNRLNNNYSMRPSRMNVKHFSPPKMIPHENWRHPNLMTMPPPQSLPPSTQSEQSHGFINPVLEKDSINDVTVSHIVDGPLVFSVQLQHRAQELEALMKSINKHLLQPLSQRADIATVCLARESKNNTVRRAVVSYVADPRAAKLFYVDYGDSETLSHSRIYDIPPQFVKPLALSVRFSLSGLSDLIVTKEMKQYFEELVKNKVLTVKIQPEEFHSPLMSFGIFYLDGKNILDMLIEAFPDSVKKWPQRQQLCSGTRDDVQISFIESCNKFFVQLITETSTIHSLAQRITEHIKIAPHLKSIEIGMKCLARSVFDSQWYRAEIVNTTDSEVLVYYVDYGNDEKISRNDLRSIRDESIAKIPPLAIQCILNGFEGVPFDVEIYGKFEKIVLDKQLSMMVNDVKPPAIVVELYDTSKKPIVNISALLRNTTVNEINPNIKLAQRRDEDNFTQSQNSRGRRSGVKTQPLLGHQNRAKHKSVKPIREDNDKWTTKSGQNEPRQQSFDNSSDNLRTGSWQATQNDDKRFNTQDQKSTKNWVTSPQNDRVNRDYPRNERYYNRDTNPRYDRSDTNERFESNNSANNYNVRDNRGGRGKGYSPNTSRSDRNNSMEKDSWSDKDSNASSRGSGKRGGRGAPRGAPRNGSGSRGRRDIGAENDRLYKPPRSSGYNNRTPPTGSRFNDRRSSERNDENPVAPIDTWDPTSVNITEKKTVSSVPQISPPNITLGAVKHCEIVYITSPSEFYVQLCPDNLELDNVMTKISEIYTTGGTILSKSSMKIGEGCIAEYSEDSTWYRAVIESIESTGATVRFVDYGNAELVAFDKIKVLQEEFAKLPIQAIGCNLLGATKTQWDTSELDRLTAISNIRPLEAEFIAQENNIYDILLRQVVDGIANDSYINEEFSDGTDLNKAKEIARNKNRPGSTAIKTHIANYAPLNQKWSEPPIYFGKGEDVIVTWLTNPNDFYVQFMRNEKEFRTMMDDIQKVYVDRQPTKESLQVGSSVIAIFAEDMALYRAEVIQLNKSHGVYVRYVDFGNCATVQPRQIFNVEKKFIILPKQSINCSLKNIVPPGTTDWPLNNSEVIDELFNVDKLQCIFHESKNKKNIVTLLNNGKDLAKIMVEKNVAAFDIATTTSELPKVNDTTAGEPNINEDLSGVDIGILTGQLLRVKVSNVESANTFHIQLPSAETSEKIVTDFMTNNDSNVMPKLSQHEVCLGAGCLIQTYDGWRRAVIINCAQTTGIDVRFIDTGAIDVVPIDRMVALPGKLSLMQKQAIECCLKDVSSSAENDEKLKLLIENKELIMQVDDIKQNKLVVCLFDETGSKIRITEKEEDENICPLIPMPILFCVQRSHVSHINHFGSVWLKRLADTNIDETLSTELYNYYTTSGRSLNVSTGKLCAAFCEDGNWYRARIIQQTEKGALVHYIDYGNNEEIISERLKELENQFLHQSQLAIEVALKVTVNSTEKEQNQILNTHLLNQHVTASLHRVDGKWMADITLSSGIKISDILSKFNVSRSETVSDVIESPKSIVSDNIKVSVCHAENPTLFWIQKSRDTSDLGTFQKKLQNEAPNYEIVNGVPENKSLCAALYSVDKMWYRAEVIDADEEMVSLRFIDYGNTDTILDLTSGMKQLPDYMKSIPPYATKCRLDLIPTSDDWTQEACARFTALTNNVFMDECVIANGNPKRIELFLNGTSVADILVNENHALKLQANEELIDEVVEVELDPRSAFISHINSPSEFWVQEQKSVANLELIADRFLVAEMLDKITDIKEGQLCVAKYPDDNSWYRARVVSNEGNGTNVIYIDYGNSAVSTEIRAIPDDVAAMPPLSRKCRLELPPGIEKWSDNVCNKFFTMSGDGLTIFLLDVIEEGETSTVKLMFENGENIVDKLLEDEVLTQIEIAEITEPCLEKLSEPTAVNDVIIDDSNVESKMINENEVIVEETAVFVSQINSPSEFWIQEEKSTENLDMVSKCLVDGASNEKIDETQMKENELCIALFPEDSCWYRARLICHGDNGTTVFFIDYGNSAVVTDVRKVPDDLISIPALSKKCSLVLPVGISQWSDESCEEFFKLVDGGAARFIVNILEESETSTVKLTLNSEDITDRLSNLCEKHGSIIEERLPPLGEENPPKYIVSHVISPAEFWTQTECKIAELEIMAEHLANASSFLTLNTLEAGTICAAIFPEDGQWYRAKILCHNESETEVLYIDYGNSAVTNQIRALPEDIVKIPALSKHCALKFPDGVESWSKEACEKFFEIVADGKTMFEYEELYGEEPTYVNLQMNGKDIVTILSPLCDTVKEIEIQSVTPDVPVKPIEIQAVKIIEQDYETQHVTTTIETLTQTYDKSSDEQSSNTSGIFIHSSTSDSSILNTTSEKDIRKELANSTFEKITDSAEILLDRISKIDELNDSTVTIEPVSEQSENQQLNIESVPSINVEKIMDEMPNDEKTICDIAENNSNINTEKIVENIISEAKDSTDEIHDTNLIEICEINGDSEKNIVQNIVIDSDNSSVDVIESVNGSQSIDIEEIIEIEKTEQVPTPPIMSKTTNSEKIVADVVTDNLLLNNPVDEVIPVESGDTSVS